MLNLKKIELVIKARKFYEDHKLTLTVEDRVILGILAIGVISWAVVIKNAIDTEKMLAESPEEPCPISNAEILKIVLEH